MGIDVEAREKGGKIEEKCENFGFNGNSRFKVKMFSSEDGADVS